MLCKAERKEIIMMIIIFLYPAFIYGLISAYYLDFGVWEYIERFSGGNRVWLVIGFFIWAIIVMVSSEIDVDATKDNWNKQ
jgi:hypothetical protein